MAYRDDYYDDDRDQMERIDEETDLSEIEDAVHEQDLFEDDAGNIWSLDDDGEFEESDIPPELLEDAEEEDWD